MRRRRVPVTLAVQTAPVSIDGHPVYGVDTIARITPAFASWLKAQGYAFACRYLGSLDAHEVATITDVGLALIPCTYADDFNPQHAIGAMRALGLPGVSRVFLDAEACSDEADVLLPKLDAWAHAVRGAGFGAGLYVGAGLKVTGEQLGALAFDRYWHSCSAVPEITLRGAPIGYCMRQLRPPNQILGGVQIDLDVIEADYRGRVPEWIVRI